MDVILLHVPNLSLKAGIPRLSIDVHLSTYESDRASAGQNVEQSRLSGARDPLDP